MGSSVPGVAINTTSAVTSNEGGTGNTATASLIVLGPPQISKAFAPAGIQPNGVSTLTVTITNPIPNAAALSGVSFTDSFPANLVVATPNGLTNTCGGTATATAGSGSVSLTGGTVAVNSNCTVSVNVTASFTGAYLNSTGPVSSTNGGTGATASATLSVANPPTISKLFLPTSVPANQTTLLSFTITNPNSNSTPPNNDVTLTGISVTDALPAGMTIASPNGASNTCGGTLTATAGSTSLSLTGGTIAPAVGLVAPRRGPVRPQQTPIADGECFIAVLVQANATGNYNNTTGAISANESGPGATSNTATLTVTPEPLAPTLTKVFGAGTILVGQSTSLTFTVANPNPSTQLVNINFTDTLPSGLTIATPSGLTGTCVSDGASITAVAGTAVIALNSLTLAGAGACSFSVNVTASTVGVKTNTTSAIAGSFNNGNGGFDVITGGTATAALTVNGVPTVTITKFHNGNFAHGQTGAMYGISVGNASTASGATSGLVTLTDTLPAGLTATAITGVGWSCTLATLTCTRSDSIGPNISYAPVMVTVNVANTAAAQIVNMATVSGGGDPNTHTASNPTTITNGAPASIVATGGTPQSLLNTTAVSPFEATVLDAGGFPVPGATVTFTASGDGTFSNGLLVTTAVTNQQGVATSPPFTAFNAAGSFTVTATVAGVAAPATFNVTVSFSSINVQVRPVSLAFTYSMGLGPAVQTQAIGVSAPVSFTLSASVAPGAPWLSASGAGGGVNATANAAGMAIGTYSGTILITVTITSPAQVIQFEVPVTLTVTGPPTLVVSAPSNQSGVTILANGLLTLTFNVPQTPGTTTTLARAATSPVPTGLTQTILLGSQNANVPFTISTSAPWLSVASTLSVTPIPLAVTVNPAGMAAGTYIGSFQIIAPQAVNSPITIPVTMNVISPLAIASGGFENAASLLPGSGAANTIMVVYGSFPCSTAQGVLVNGAAVEVITATSSFISFTLPPSVDGQSSASVQVTCNGEPSAASTLPLAAVSPGIFTLSETGTGQGAVVNADGTVNGPSNPAAPNSLVAVYTTGFGAYQSPLANGLQLLTNTVQATVGGVPAEVQFYGHAPDSTLGLQQINVILPPGIPGGAAVPLQLTVDGVSTQPGVTVAIQTGSTNVVR